MAVTREHRLQKMKDWKKAKMADPDYREQRARKERERRAAMSPEHKQELNAVAKARYQDRVVKEPEFRDRRAAVVRARKNRNLEKYLFENARIEAPKRGLVFQLTLEDITIPEFCPVFGTKLDRYAPQRAPNRPSLDRVDNALGYVSGNVRVVSWEANYLKSKMTAEQALSIAEYILKHKAGAL